jgi:hypothetical protein
MMPVFVRAMLILGLLALLAAVSLVRQSEQTAGPPHSTPSIGSGKPVGTSTLNHGGPAPTANQSDARDSGSQR